MSQEPNALNDDELEDVSGGWVRLNTPKPTTADIRAKRLAESNYSQTSSSNVPKRAQVMLNLEADN